jgi:hypothetical protein
MEKMTLSKILKDCKIFKVPDYQRGYAWEKKQWEDFVQDLDALIEEENINHYTGTIVIFASKEKPVLYGNNNFNIVEVVDGQQRLITSSLYLSIIIKELEKLEKDFTTDIMNYLYFETTSKLKPNNETGEFYLELIRNGRSNVEANDVHKKRLLEAYNYLKDHLNNQTKIRQQDKKEYLTSLYDAITRKLNFSFYTIEDESEIGMTFELMNSRGKNLSSMELLKNYLMYWINKHTAPTGSERSDYINKINKAWKDVYTNITQCNGNDTQCLRIAWTLYVKHTPKDWSGYSGFKANDVIPLRGLTEKSKEGIKKFLNEFIEGLGEVSHHYSNIIKPDEGKLEKEEFEYLSKINNVGNIANFLPLIVAVRIKKEKGEITDIEYIDSLKSLEKYSFRVFLWESKRSNAGISKFYRWANEIFKSKETINNILKSIYGTIQWYSKEEEFCGRLTGEFDWYHKMRLLKYTLFEYELHLLIGKDKSKLEWSDLNDSTIEHILPQSPKEDSEWLKKWSEEDKKKYLHDISNLVLTKDNSKYSNFEFSKKKGCAGAEGCYAHSNIKQEREISNYDDWTVEECKERRKKLLDWIIKNWSIPENISLDTSEPDEDEGDLPSGIDNNAIY